jgi:hypothetical protein
MEDLSLFQFRKGRSGIGPSPDPETSGGEGRMAVVLNRHCFYNETPLFLERVFEHLPNGPEVLSRPGAIPDSKLTASTVGDSASRDRTG